MTCHDSSLPGASVERGLGYPSLWCWCWSLINQMGAKKNTWNQSGRKIQYLPYIMYIAKMFQHTFFTSGIFCSENRGLSRSSMAEGGDWTRPTGGTSSFRSANGPGPRSMPELVDFSVFLSRKNHIAAGLWRNTKKLGETAIQHEPFLVHGRKKHCEVRRATADAVATAALSWTTQECFPFWNSYTSWGTTWNNHQGYTVIFMDMFG